MTNPIITISHLIYVIYLPFWFYLPILISFISFKRKAQHTPTSHLRRKRESQAWNCKSPLLIKINSVCGATGDSHKIENSVNITMMRVQSTTERQRSHRWDERSIIKPSRSTFLSLFFSSFLSFYPFTHESPLRAFREWPIAIKRNETQPKREKERKIERERTREIEKKKRK